MEKGEVVLEQEMIELAKILANELEEKPRQPL